VALRPRALAGAAFVHKHEYADDQEHAPELCETSQRVIVIVGALDQASAQDGHSVRDGRERSGLRVLYGALNNGTLLGSSKAITPPQAAPQGGLLAKMS
jgi:hypothetical protein